MPRLILALILVLAAALPAQAERRVALVFGLDDYRLIRPLDNAGNDARTMAETLEALDFEVTVETDRDLRRMRRALEDFVEDGAGADVALVFYAGHGVEIGGDNRLLPVDADPASVETLRATSLPLEEVRATAAQVAPVVLILVDACREDPFGEGAGQGGRAGVALAPRVKAEVKAGMGRMGQAENTLFAFAAAPGATAADGSGNSPFTAALSRYLGTAGIEIRSALTLVQQEVYDRTRGRQLPYVENGLPALFFAAAGPQAAGGELPERERLLMAMAGLTPELRADVERIAAEKDVPLAPLFGALLSADLPGLAAAARAEELRKAAAAYAETLAQLRSLSAADPEVQALRDAAEEALALGSFDTARQALDRAIRLDLGAIDDIRATLERRILSAAASLWAKAGVAMTGLDTPGAIAALDEAMGLLADIDPVSLEADDWITYDNVIGTLARLRELSGDTAEAERLLRLWLAQAEARFDRRGDADSERDISVALDRLGGVLMTRGDRAGALDAYERGLAIGERLHATDPDNPVYRRDMTVSLVKIGDMRRAAGDHAAAEAAFRRAVEMARALAADHPEVAEFRRDPVSALTRLGDELVDQARLDEALAAFTEAQGLADAMALDYPDDTEVTRDRALSWVKIANVHYVRQDYAGMAGAAGKALEIAAALAARDPANLQWQRDEALAHSLLGDAVAAQTRQAEARQHFGRALEIVRRLAGADPDSVAAQADLAMTLNRLGDAESLDGAPEASRRHQEEALAIWRRLVAADPDNPGLRQSLMMGLVKLSFVHPDAVALLTEALALAEALTAEGAFPAWQMDWPAFIREVLALHGGPQEAAPGAETDPATRATGTEPRSRRRR